MGSSLNGGEASRHSAETHPNSNQKQIMSIQTLLQAAEYLERREREAEHGYATSLPVIEYQNTPKPTRLTKVSKKPQGGSRSSHNELEKNRRAHLRGCLESLKDLVPLGSDSSRHTTLGLLNKAKHFIKTLEDKDRKSLTHKENLHREQRYLRRRLELLSCQVDAIHKRRSISESSTSTVSSIQSSSTSESDEHEVDLTGYGGISDDDHSSIRSSGSDGGMTVNTWSQLTIADNI